VRDRLKTFLLPEEIVDDIVDKNNFQDAVIHCGEVRGERLSSFGEVCTRAS